MDRTDVSLCLSLMLNSRTPYHELATRLGLSINAVHKRVSAMTNLGIIRAFTAHPSLASVGATSVWVYGRSEAVRPGDAHLRLKTDERIYWVANSGGGYIYTGGYLRTIAELDQFVAFVKKEVEMSEPTVGIILGSPPVTSLARSEKLRPLDYQILASLRKDSKKPVSDVASEVKASAKTVHRRLEWMMDKGLVEFTIDWYPDASNDIVGLCHVEIAPGYDRQRMLEVLRQMFQQNILVEVLFSNLPNLIVLFLWTNSMKQMESLRERAAGTSGAKSVMLNVLQIGYMFDTWRDKFSSGMPDPSP
ncbi:MAG TPA: winged helix-turn-helix transcriptional regulator [Nitrososphaerales archaeon]|nr:winged helix-turn-helix transcriptional regulator [Nitrososphaerales archaeon]